jgi:glutaredoxin 3
MAEILLYTKPWCGYCFMAKRLLQQKGVAYREIDTNGDEKTRAWLREATGQSTVPQLFVDGKSYGGYTDMAALDRAGELDAILAVSPRA